MSPLHRQLHGRPTRHLRRMRTLYTRRQFVLVEALNERMGDRLDVSPDQAGLTLTAFLRRAARRRGRGGGDRDLVVPSRSLYTSRSLDRDGLVLGDAAPDAIDAPHDRVPTIR